ncbi:MAG: hypothetical protein NZ765_03675, partial [Anaerolineae bacterium]|nr:hypothetical protein [Anaerolineae bacterium]MDW8070642.1 hypothetical protein [Anaerolineae bacterium]
MTAQAPLVLTAGGTVAVLMWLLALGWYLRHPVQMEGVTARPIVAHVLTRLGLLIGTAGWGGYAALMWPQLPWRVAVLPPVALAALVVHMLLTRRLSGVFLRLWWYSCALIAYSTTLASFWIRDGAGALVIPPAFILVVI